MSLTLSGKHRLRVFGNRALRKMFGPKRYEATWELNSLNNKKLHDL